MAASRQSKHSQAATATVDGTDLSRYLDLMQAYVATEISALDFERRYLDLFGDDETLHPEATFKALNDLFFAVDAFCADPDLRDADDLDEDQLRAQVLATRIMLDPSVDGAMQSAR